MKLKIKVKLFGDQILPEIIDKGDWIDLRAAGTVELKGPTILKDTKKVVFDTRLIKLGVAIELPAGFEAQVLPRSSSPKLHIFQTNSEAVIDNSFSGDDDQWRYWVTALADTTINKGDRICQFRIQLSQKATFWQKLKWLFSSGIKIEQVEKLNTINRGGIGSSGKR